MSTFNINNFDIDKLKTSIGDYETISKAITRFSDAIANRSSIPRSKDALNFLYAAVQYLDITENHSIIDNSDIYQLCFKFASDFRNLLVEKLNSMTISTEYDYDEPEQNPTTRLDIYLGRHVRIYTEKEEDDYFEGVLCSIEFRYEDTDEEACNVNHLQTTIILNMVLLNGADIKEIQIEANDIKKIELV